MCAIGLCIANKGSVATLRGDLRVGGKDGSGSCVLAVVYELSDHSWRNFNLETCRTMS